MDTAAFKLLILDVDGVLTDGRIAMTATGESTKTFYVQDGHAIKQWQRSGGTVAILSGRSCEALSKRAEELGIKLVESGVADKIAGYDRILESVGVQDQAVVYIGDDAPDLGPMARCGFPVAAANAVGEVKRAARYVTRRSGGEGAVAETVELLLRLGGRWTNDQAVPESITE